MPKTATPRKPETLSRKLAEARNTSSNRSLPKLGDNEKRYAVDIGSGLNDVIGRGMIAGLLGIPGEAGGLVENGLRALLGKPQVQPYGGSEHIGQKMQDYGLVSDVRRPKTELLASLISPSAAAKTILNAPKTARNALLALDNLSAPRTMANYGQRGAIDVWHGSPHKFDTFKAMDNIGGGEGAQAYGHGGYHASNKDVGISYKQSLSPEYRSVISYAGPDRERQAASLLGSNIPEKDVLNLLADLGDDAPELTLERGRKILAQAEESGNLYRNQLRWPDPAREAADPLSDKHFLDWDKPLSEQDASVQDAIGNYALLNKPVDMNLTGEQFYKRMMMKNAAYSDVGANGASKDLNWYGIPGIRYLDGGSRSAGQGSHNYVTFDDNLVNILERNGQPVTAPQPGLLGKMVKEKKKPK